MQPFSKPIYFSLINESLEKLGNLKLERSTTMSLEARGTHSVHPKIQKDKETKRIKCEK
jgi:hypothetical protein